MLLDENLPHALRHFLPRNEVFTAAYKGWDGLGNGELLARAAADGIDVLITLDRGIEYEQNLRTLPVAVIKVGARSSKLLDLMPLVPAILAALGMLQPRTLVRVP